MSPDLATTDLPDADAPDPPTRQRMLAAFATACRRHDLAATSDQVIWGWRGRTLSARARHGDSSYWMRLASSPAREIPQPFWHGNRTAQAELPAAIPRPRLLTFEEASDGDWAYATEIFEISPTPVLDPQKTASRPVLPDDDWWQDLRAALDSVAAIPTDRRPVTPAFLDTVMTYVLGDRAPTKPAEPWVTAHADLHWGNLGGPALTMFDWEGWGTVPAGYDAATLLAYSLTCPQTTAEVRRRFADQLDTPAGRYAQAAVLSLRIWYRRDEPGNAHAALMRAELGCLLAR